MPTSFSRPTLSLHSRALGHGRVVAGAAAVALTLIAGGCGGGHGKYTKAHMSGAKAKMAALKSGTEFQMAQQAFLGGDLHKALKHGDYSISLNEKVAKSHVLRGRVLMEMGDLEGSAAALAKAAELEPDNVDSEYYRGILAERIDQHPEALARYSRAAELDGANPQYAIAAAEMMIELGRVDEAEGYLTTRTASFQHNAGVRQALGHIALMKEQPDRAATLFNEARLLAPDDKNIIEDLVRAQVATGKFVEAEYNLGRLLQAPGAKGRRDLLHTRARCLVQLDRPVDARDVMAELVKGAEGASDVEAWIGFGQASYVLRDAPRVKQAASRAIALAPTRPEGYVLRALNQRQTGDLRGAADNLLKALSLREAPETHVMLGVVQRSMNRPAEARVSFGKALALDPTDASARQMLAALDAPAVAAAAAE